MSLWDRLGDVMQGRVGKFDHEYKKATTTQFDELRVAGATSLIHRQSSGIDLILDRVITNGSGAVTDDGDTVGINISTGSTADSDALLRTTEFGRYVPGLVAEPSIGFNLKTQPTGDQVFRAGYYNDDTGIGIVEDADGPHAFIRVTENGVTEDHLIDLETSFSDRGFTIASFPFRFYGSGPAQVWLSFQDSREYMENLRITDHDLGMFLNQPNLPLRAEVENGSTTENLEALIGGRAYRVWGDYEEDWDITGKRVSGVTVDPTDWTPLISARIHPDEFGAYVVPAATGVFPDDDVDVQLFYDSDLNATWEGPEQVTAGESPVEFDTSTTTAEFSPGEGKFPSFVIGGQGSRLGAAEKELPDIAVPAVAADGMGNVTLAARAAGGASTTVTAFLRMAEEII